MFCCGLYFSKPGKDWLRKFASQSRRSWNQISLKFDCDHPHDSGDAGDDGMADLRNDTDTEDD
ncbi:hypothetical protein BG842_06250 [Haladaptatus sp. W1]|nr:hypothetical protein BG842_06250 [Haladaptatus sp. W1]